MPIIWAASLRHSLLLEGGLSGAVLRLGRLFSTGAGDVGSLIEMSIFEKDQPKSQRKENRRARKKHRFEAQVSVNSKADQQQPDDERAKKTNDNAQHPRGKIRAKHIHGRRMSTTAQ
jgi:hypothetical protein